MIYGASHLLRMMLENKVLNQRVTEDMTHGMMAWPICSIILEFLKSHPEFCSSIQVHHHRCCQSGSNWEYLAESTT